MEVIVGSAEEGGEVVALDGRLLDNIEVGLFLSSVSQDLRCPPGAQVVSRLDLTFTNPLLRPYIVLIASGSEKDKVLGPRRTTGPCFL